MLLTHFTLNKAHEERGECPTVKKLYKKEKSFLSLTKIEHVPDGVIVDILEDQLPHRVVGVVAVPIEEGG